MRRWLVLALLGAGVGPLAHAGAKPCVSAEQAQAMLKKDVCVAAHVYEVVELPDGTRYLDICPPDVNDADCRFTIVSLRQDRESVGELRSYRGADIHLRGIVQPMHGRAGMVLSHARQFYGGPPRFRPNPRLARGFEAEQERPAIADPNLRPQGRGRSFMNRLDRESRPAK